MKEKVKSVTSNPLFSGGMIMIVGSMVVNAVNYLYHLLMGRVLGPEQYGALASIYSVLYIISVVPQSSSISIVKFISRAKNRSERVHVYNSIHALTKKIAIIGTLALLIIAPIERQFLNIDSLLALIWVAPVFYFSIMTITNQAALQGMMSFNGVVISNMLFSLVKLILGLILIYLGYALGGAIFAVAIGIFLSYLLSHLYIRRDVKGDEGETYNFDPTEFFKYSGPVIIQALAFTSLFTIDLVLVKHFFPDFEAGLYAAISTLGKIIFFAASPITAVMFPFVSRRNSSGKSSKDVLLLSLFVTSSISLGITSIYFLFPHLTISILYGNKYLEAGSLLVWMGLFISIYTIAQQIVNYFLSIDQTKVVVVPLIAAILQAFLIYVFHNSLLIVIQISLGLVVVTTLFLIVLLTYNQKHER